MPQPLDLDAIEARAAAATPGPWCTDSWEIYQGTEYQPGLSAWIGETCRGTSSLEQDRADATFVAAARTDVPALAAEIRRLRARTLTESEHNRAWHAIEGAAGEEGADPGTVLNAVLRALGINPPAEETHVVADDTIWLQQRPCGCIVAAAVAVVPGDRTLATTEQAHQHFNPTALDRGRAATAGLTVVPVSSAEYRERRDRWRCDKHAAAQPATRP